MLKRHNMNTIKNLHYFSEGLSGAYGTNGVFNLNWNSACYKNLPRKALTSAPASFLCFSNRNLPCSNEVKIGIFY